MVAVLPDLARGNVESGGRRGGVDDVRRVSCSKGKSLELSACARTLARVFFPAGAIGIPSPLRPRWLLLEPPSPLLLPFLGESDVEEGGLEACFDDNACLDPVVAFFNGESKVRLSEFMKACLARLPVELPTVLPPPPALDEFRTLFSSP